MHNGHMCSDDIAALFPNRFGYISTGYISTFHIGYDISRSSTSGQVCVPHEQCWTAWAPVPTAHSMRQSAVTCSGVCARSWSAKRSLSTTPMAISAIPPPDNREPHNPRKRHRKTLSPVPQLRGTRLNIIELTSAAQDDRLSPRRHPDHSRRRFRRAVRRRSGPERRSAGHGRRRPSGRR